MARATLTFSASTDPQDFMTNYRRGPEYNVTIQNNTNQTINVTVSNQSANRGETPVFANPSTGALAITAGSLERIIEPVAMLRLTPAVAATGTVTILEAG